MILDVAAPSLVDKAASDNTIIIIVGIVIIICFAMTTLIFIKKIKGGKNEKN